MCLANADDPVSFHIDKIPVYQAASHYSKSCRNLTSILNKMAQQIVTR